MLCRSESVLFRFLLGERGSSVSSSPSIPRGRTTPRCQLNCSTMSDTRDLVCACRGLIGRAKQNNFHFDSQNMIAIAHYFQQSKFELTQTFVLTLAGTFLFCFSQNCQPHTRDQRAKKSSRAQSSGRIHDTQSAEKKTLSTRGLDTAQLEECWNLYKCMCEYIYGAVWIRGEKCRSIIEEPDFIHGFLQA